MSQIPIFSAMNPYRRASTFDDEQSDLASAQPEERSMIAPWLRGEGEAPGLLGLFERYSNPMRQRVMGLTLADRMLRSDVGRAAAMSYGLSVPAGPAATPAGAPTSVGGGASGQPAAMTAIDRDAARMAAIKEAQGFGVSGVLDARDQQRAAAAAAEAERHIVRPVRMPNGTIVFTNYKDGAPGGSPMSYAAAVSEEMGGPQAPQPVVSAPGVGSATAPQRTWLDEWQSGFKPRMIGGTDARTESMRALVRNSQLAARERAAGDRPEARLFTNASLPPSPGTVSELGQPGVANRQSLLEDALGMTALGRTRQQQELAEMPVMDAMAAENPDILAGQWMLNTVRPVYDQAVSELRDATDKIALLSTPTLPTGQPNPSYIPDEGMRRARAREISGEAERALQTITAIMAALRTTGAVPMMRR